MPSSHLILCRPLFLLPPIPPSIRVFSNESTLHMRRPKYWSFSFSTIPSKEHPGLISFRMDWLYLLALSTSKQWLCTFSLSHLSFDPTGVGLDATNDGDFPGVPRPPHRLLLSHICQWTSHRQQDLLLCAGAIPPTSQSSG